MVSARSSADIEWFIHKFDGFCLHGTWKIYLIFPASGRILVLVAAFFY